MNKDNQIQKYDKQIVINNISILMKDKGVTQAELVTALEGKEISHSLSL